MHFFDVANIIVSCIQVFRMRRSEVRGSFKGTRAGLLMSFFFPMFNHVVKGVNKAKNKGKDQIDRIDIGC